MKFKIDENLPIELSELLQEAGYESITVLEQHLGGSPDIDIALVCQLTTGHFFRDRLTMD